MSLPLVFCFAKGILSRFKHICEEPLIHPADSGWGYQIYYNGGKVASLFDSKELAFDIAVKWGSQRFSLPPGPEVFFDPRFGELYEEVEHSEEYRAAVRAQFAQCNVSFFRLFNVEPETIDNLHQLFSRETVEVSLADLRQRVSCFKSYLNLQEMDWKSYKSALFDIEEGR